MTVSSSSSGKSETPLNQPKDYGIQATTDGPLAPSTFFPSDILKEGV